MKPCAEGKVAQTGGGRSPLVRQQPFARDGKYGLGEAAEDAGGNRAPYLIDHWRGFCSRD